MAQPPEAHDLLQGICEEGQPRVLVIQFSRTQDALHTQVCDTLVDTHPYAGLRSGRDRRVGGVGPRHLINTSALELVHLREAGAGHMPIEVERTIESPPPLHTSSG